MKKNVYVAYALLFFGAIIGSGLHRFYVGDKKFGVAQIVLFWIGKITFSYAIGKILLFAWCIWWLIDLVITVDLVEKVNLTKQVKA